MFGMIFQVGLQQVDERSSTGSDMIFLLHSWKDVLVDTCCSNREGYLSRQSLQILCGPNIPAYVFIVGPEPKHDVPR